MVLNRIVSGRGGDGASSLLGTGGAGSRAGFADGGGIYASNNILVSFSTVSQNSATGGRGGDGGTGAGNGGAGGDEGEAAFRRLALAVTKSWVCKQAPAHAAEALECLGGNGYVEESGMPRLYREAPLQSINAKTGSGSWNAAHFNNSTYDTLSKQYIEAVDLSSARTIAGKIERLLLDETPIIFAYFYDYLSASQKNITGTYQPTQGQFFLWHTKKA